MQGAELKRAFGLRVRALRERQGLSQERLAELIERSLDTVGNIERGANSTRLEIAVRLAEALGVSLSELFDIDDAPDAGRERRRQIAGISRRLERQDQETFEFLCSVLDAAFRLAQHRR